MCPDESPCVSSRWRACPIISETLSIPFASCDAQCRSGIPKLTSALQRAVVAVFGANKAIEFASRRDKMRAWQHAIKRRLRVVVTVSYIAGTPKIMRTVALLLVTAVSCHGFNFLKAKPAAATSASKAKPPTKPVKASSKGIKKVVAPPKGKKAAPAPAAKKPAFANPFAAKSKAAPAPAKKGGFSFGGAKPATKAKKAAPPPPKPSKGKAPPPKAKAPPPTFNKPKRQSQGAPGTPGGIQFAPSKPQARSYGRKFDEFLYDPNDELAKARAAFGKK